MVNIIYLPAQIGLATGGRWDIFCGVRKPRIARDVRFLFINFPLNTHIASRQILYVFGTENRVSHSLKYVFLFKKEERLNSVESFFFSLPITRRRLNIFFVAKGNFSGGII